jgi:hypothetical protein
MSLRELERSFTLVQKLAERFPEEWAGEDLTGEAPLRVHVGAGAPRRVLVTNCEPALRRWDRGDWPAGLVVVAPLGLLRRGQVRAISALAPRSTAPVAFVGSASPMSLHLYACLRAHLGPRRVRFCGICDQVLERIGEPRGQPETLHTWEANAFDRRQQRIVERLVDVERTLGPRTAAVVRSGRTISIAAISFRGELIGELYRTALRVATADPHPRGRA